jgi:hypothetical protein
MDRVLHVDLAPDLHGGFNTLEQALAKRPVKYGVGDRTVELELATASQLWGQRGYEFRPEFLDRLRDIMEMACSSSTHESAERRVAINRLLRSGHRRIPELIPQEANEFTSGTHRRDLLKAHGQPVRHGTAPEPFYRLDGSQVQAELMHSTPACATALALLSSGDSIRWRRVGDVRHRT